MKSIIMVRKILATLQPLLQEFQDVIRDEIPPGLPPEHFIDFVPGASIPHKASCI
jgi:hypothetical protein